MLRRILVYGPKDPVGGVEKIVFEYVKNIMKNHDDVSFDFLQYGSGFSMEKEITDLGCRVLYLPGRKNFFAYKSALGRIFAENKYAAVWGNYSGLTNIDLLTFAKKYNVPVRIAHSHGSKFYWGNALMRFVVPTLHYLNTLRIGACGTHFFACSDSAGEFMFPSWLQDKVEIVPNAVDLSRFTPDPLTRADARAEFALSDDNIVIGHVARMCEVKNQTFLLEAVAAALRLNPKVKLLFVGDGEYREIVEEKIKELGIEDAVILTGQRDDAARLYQAMDVFALTSFSEGLSVSAVEAQASGVPCVLPTTVSSLTDVSGCVSFLPLESGALRWAETLIEWAKFDTDSSRENIIKSGFDMQTASENLYKKFIG